MKRKRLLIAGWILVLLTVSPTLLLAAPSVEINIVGRARPSVDSPDGKRLNEERVASGAGAVDLGKYDRWTLQVVNRSSSELELHLFLTMNTNRMVYWPGMRNGPDPFKLKPGSTNTVEIQLHRRAKGPFHTFAADRTALQFRQRLVNRFPKKLRNQPWVQEWCNSPPLFTGPVIYPQTIPYDNEHIAQVDDQKKAQGRESHLGAKTK